MAHMIASRLAPTPLRAPMRVADGRYLIVPCEASGCSDLAIIWDRLEEQVVDVISAAASSHYSDEDMLWDEWRTEAAGADFADPFRMAA